MSLELARQAVEATKNPVRAEQWTHIQESWAATGQDTFRPRVYVYFDFLRAVMVSKRFGAANLIMDESYRKRQVVNRAYNSIRHLYYSVINPDPTFSKRPEYHDTHEGMQDFINFVLNHLITQVNIQRARIGTGTCSVTFEYSASKDLTQDPLFSQLDTFIDQLLTPHTHMEVWGTGRFNRSQAYPMFAGMTSSATMSRTGMRRLVVDSEDYTKLLRISDVIVNPAFINPELRKSDPKGLTIHGSVFYGSKASNIIKQLIQGVGKGTTYGGVLDYKVITDMDDIRDALQIQPLAKTTFEGSKAKKPMFPRKCFIWGVDATPYRIFTVQMFPVVRSQIRNRFEMCRDVAQRMFAEFYCDKAGNLQFHPMRISSLFLVNPVMEDKVKSRYTQRYFVSAAKTASKAARASIAPTEGTPDQYASTMADVATQEKGKWKTRTYVKKSYAFIQMADKTHNPYIIPDKEIYDFTDTISDKELATSITMYGDSMLTQLGLYAELQGLVGYRDNKRWIQQFGFRRKEISNPMMNVGGKTLTMYADAHFALINGEMNTANCTMVFRPEIDLAMPVAFPDQNKIYYINTITHSFHVGQESMTAIGLSFGRKLTDTDAINFFDHLAVTEGNLTRSGKKDIERVFGKYIADKTGEEYKQATDYADGT